VTFGGDEVGLHRERRRLRAVVADDDEGMRRLLAAVLELDGWEVRCAADGDEAVSMSEGYEPDAVFLDVKMPGSDGISALRRLRQTESGRGYAIVMVSGEDDPSAESEAAEAGADDYLLKPLAIDDVSSRVLRLVNGTSLPVE
jgi:DNA-binding response OmpR family regulator